VTAPAEPMRLPALPPPNSTEQELPLQAVEFEAVMRPQGQRLKFSPTLVGRTVTVWASHRTVHVLLDGQLIRTRTMSFTDPTCTD
jgi:hypothetical protein